MSEIEDLLSLYGAIDRAVVGDGDLLADVAILIPGYQDEVLGSGEPYSGWFDRFLEGLEAVGGDPRQVDQPLGAALERLAELPPRGRLGVRRLIALATLARIRERLDPEPSEAELGGAIGPGLAGADLLPVLASATELAMVLEHVPDDVMTPEEKALHTAHPPLCKGALMLPPGPTTVPVASFRTRAVIPKTGKLTFKKLTSFLDPKLWPGNHPFWCCMTVLGKTSNGVRYREKVSFDCSRAGSVWGTSAELELQRATTSKSVNRPRRDRVHYDLNPPPKPTDTVQVDVGDLVVTDAPAGFVTIETTKRVGFNPPSATPSLAIGLCHAGYGDAVHDLVLRCATADPADQRPYGIDCT